MSLPLDKFKKSFAVQKAERFFKERRIPLQMTDLSRSRIGRKELELFAGVLGLLLFREIPKLQVVLGGCVVILGVYVYSRFAEPPKGGAEHEES